ncbi:hypothetical protein PS6_011450, partial [Mucor atramentarius]
MKLRDRQKRVLDNIKQEDKKAAINLIDTPSSAPNESSVYSFNIKQEDTKNDSSLLQQDERFEEGKDYYYDCDMCKKRMPNLKSVLQHRKSIHNVRATGHRMIEDINTEPDVHDPNFYCRILKSGSPRSAIVPDPDDLSLHCRACDSTYARKSTYKQHCQYIHGMTSVKFGTARPKPDGIASTYCKICDVRLASKQSYKSHLFSIHKVDWRLNQQKSKGIAPDVNDPNFYCCACEKKLSCKGSFKLHLIALHAIYLSAPKKNDLEPDTDDPNNNCRACKKNYNSRGKYRNHLRFVHHMDLPPLRSNTSFGSQPNPNDPHHYC